MYTEFKSRREDGGGGDIQRERRLVYTEVTTDPKNVGKSVVSGDST